MRTLCVCAWNERKTVWPLKDALYPFSQQRALHPFRLYAADDGDFLKMSYKKLVPKTSVGRVNCTSDKKRIPLYSLNQELIQKDRIFHNKNRIKAFFISPFMFPRLFHGYFVCSRLAAKTADMKNGQPFQAKEFLVLGLKWFIISVEMNLSLIHK
jgi:hypothetical protein